MSVIDYIFVSNGSNKSISSVTIQDSGVNFSVNVPVIAKFKVIIGKRKGVSN